MALVRELLQELYTPSGYNQNYGLVVPRPQLVTGYIRPWRINRAEDSGVSRVVKHEDGLKITLDVQQFKPEDLSINVVDDFVVVEGRHEERTDEHGFVSRQFTRRYRLPNDVNKEAIQSTLSSDSVLQLVVPKKAVENKTEINIPISKIGLPASPFTSPKPPAEKRMKLEIGA